MIIYFKKKSYKIQLKKGFIINLRDALDILKSNEDIFIKQKVILNQKINIFINLKYIFNFCNNFYINLDK